MNEFASTSSTLHTYCVRKGERAVRVMQPRKNNANGMQGRVGE